MDPPESEPFLRRRMKMLSRPDGFILYGQTGLDFFSVSESLYPNMKLRIWLFRARLSFCMISDNPNVSLGIVDISLYTCRIALKNDYHKKMDMLANTLAEFKYLETKEKTIVVPAGKNNSFSKRLQTMQHFVVLLLQWIQTLHSLHHKLKVQFDVCISISNKWKYSGMVNQS